MMIDSMLFYQAESIDDFRMWVLIGSDNVLLLSGYAQIGIVSERTHTIIYA